MESVMTIDEFGTKVWRNTAGQIHREDGPAVILKNGAKWWHFDGELHRIDGPAIEWADGSKVWYLHNKLHREDGPAIERADGTKEWYLNDEQYKKRKYYTKIKKLIIKNIGLETAEIFKFNEKNAWKLLETRALADYIEEKGYLKTANQIRNLIKFASFRWTGI